MLIALFDRKHKRSLRIFHGTANVKHGYFFSEWQRQQGMISDFIAFTGYPWRDYAHLTLHIKAYNILARSVIVFMTFLLCLVKYDLFHFYFGSSLLPFNLDLPLLKLCRKKIFMTYCGSDIRLIEVEKTYNPYARFLKVERNHPAWDRRKKRMMRWQQMWIDRFSALRNLAKSALVVIPKEKLVTDIWLNNTMDIAAYSPTITTKKLPTIVHAPTNPPIKGSVHVEQAIEALKTQGYQFEYLELRKEEYGYYDALKVYRDQADIIIDQLYIGDFGNVSVEAMYYGKPVCCFLTDNIQQETPDCPIVNCTIDTLKEKLAWLITHPEERIRLGREGRTFVETHCDREKINRQLLAVYHEIL